MNSKKEIELRETCSVEKNTRERNVLSGSEKPGQQGSKTIFISKEIVLRVIKRVTKL